ncbi:type VII secretion integral membrane protein EccD [Mycobacterium sp. pUA109]|uniref:type VII secretion integral membrane protein EccD n=1 Tax=Mycobacterium sp. pUA109 TaxID=3238982 RepID=UPI00351BD8B5
MTTMVEVAQPDTEPSVTGPRAAVIGIMAGAGVQIGVLLDADAPVSVMIDPLLKVINSRLRELGEKPLEAKGRGRWVLCLVDGTALRSTQSLTEQEVYDGDRLWLRFLEDTERRSQVIEHISTAVAVNLSERFTAINPVAAVQVGVAMLAIGVLLAVGLLGGWRYRHDSWLAAGWGGIIAVLVFAAAVLILLRARTVPERRVGDILLLTALPALAVAAAAAVPGPVGAPHAAFGFGVAGVTALLLMRFTGRRLGIYTAIITISVAVMLVGVLRMVALAGAVPLMGCLLLACVLGYQTAPSLSRWLTGIRLPVFPSATSRWVFEARPDLPTTVVKAEGAAPVLEGPESVREVVLRAERARSFLTGLLAGLGVLIAASAAGLCDPSSDRRWLPLFLAGFTTGFLILRGRSFLDRWQAITVTVTGVAIPAIVAVRYVVVLWTPAALSIGVAVLIVLPAAGLIAAAVVPNTIYSPLFRKLVEWVEYLCLMPLFPLALWLMNTYEAIRYR